MAKRSAPSRPAAFTGDERIVVIHGEELFLRSEYLRMLREALTEAHGEVETIRIDANGTQLADVLDELRSFGLMQQHKLIVVDECEKFVSDHRPTLEKYAENPEAMSTLVLRSKNWNKGNLDKLIANVGQVIKCDTPEPHEAEAWLIERAKSQYGVKVDRRAAVLMVEHLGANLGRLDGELGKLCAATPEGGELSLDTVEALMGRGSDEKAWMIQEALLGGEARQAVEVLHELLDLADQPKELVMYFISDLVRKLHHAAAMKRQGAKAFDICQELRIWPKDKQRPFLDAADRLGTNGAARLLGTLVDLDSRGKSMTSVDISTGLERFCIQFAGAVR